MNKKYIVEKSNTLNSLMQYGITLTELRFFCLYLSKLNSRVPDSRHVEISIKEFEDFFDVKVNTTIFSKKIKKIAGRTVEIKENKKIKVLTLYSEFCWSEEKPTTLSIICNDRMLPYLFELQHKYTSYTIGNIAKLTTVSQIRLYELCKQYEKMKEIKFEFEEIKLLLCSSANADFRHFRVFTLEPAINSVNNNTDIIATYEKITSGRKVTAIKFYIESKKKSVEVQEVRQIEVTESVKAPASEPEKKDLRNLYNKYFSKEQEEMFKAKIHTVLQNVYKTDDMLKTRTNAIYSKCLINFEMKQQTGTLKNPLAYMSGIITNAVSSEIDKPMKEKNRSYNLGDFEKLAINHKEIEEIEQSKSVEKEKCSCTQSHGSVSRSEIDRVITPVDEETAIQVKIDGTDDIMQADADLCLKAAELVKNATDYDSAVKLLDMFMTGWRDFDGFFLDQINEALEKKEVTK